jgi:LmbE family N-acetylglucosaminyl deacetylase
MFGRRILVCVPHPDDEVVACAAAIGRARADGGQVFAVYLTDGCIPREADWPWRRARHAEAVERRRVEAERVAGRLGLSPVGWAARPARRLWRELPAVFDEIRVAIDRCAADQLWVPAYEGGNPDHDGLNGLAQRFADRLEVLEFAEYNYFRSRAHAQQFPFPNGAETTLILSAEERARKRALLDLYVSERQNLGYVGLDQECSRGLARYDYRQPPHPGVLWYARHHWVPFRHPRVDFTRPHEVSDAIKAFLDDAPASSARVAPSGSDPI